MPPTMTANQLLATDFGPLEMVVEGLLPKGLTILAGKAKQGKTILATNLAIALANGETFLGVFPTVPQQVLCIFLEDSFRRVQQRLLKMGFTPKNENLHVGTTWPTMMEGGLETLEKWLSCNNTTRVVIIDTLTAFRGFQKGGSGYLREYGMMTKIKDLAAKHDASIILLLHQRKDVPADEYDGIAGSTGIPAGADNVLLLRKDRGQSNGTIFVSGREVSEAKYAIGLNDESITWEMRGDVEELALSSARRQVVDYLKDIKKQVQLKDISAALDKSKNLIHKLLAALCSDGFVRHCEGGCYQYIDKQVNAVNVVNPVNAS